MPVAVKTSRKIFKAAGVRVDVAKTIGGRLRALRKAQKIRLVELAKSSEVDAATISRIETGRMTGTLESHMRLARGLGVKLTDLYAGIEEARTKEAVAVQSTRQRTEAYVHQAVKWSMTMLTSDVLQKKLMPTLLSIEPGGHTATEEAKVGTERFLYVLEGELEARVGEQTHQLKRGSALYFDASVLHSFRNVSHRSVKCLSVVTPPVL